MEEQAPVSLKVEIKGTVMPTWLAVSLGCAAVLAAVSLLLMTFLVRDALHEYAVELRVLQLHTQDVEAVLIRSGHANRSDFAPWDKDQKRKNNEEE